MVNFLGSHNIWVSDSKKLVLFVYTLKENYRTKGLLPECALYRKEELKAVYGKDPDPKVNIFEWFFFSSFLSYFSLFSCPYFVGFLWRRINSKQLGKEKINVTSLSLSLSLCVLQALGMYGRYVTDQ